MAENSGTVDHSFYTPRDWSGSFDGEMNMSVFVFRDVKGNGSYECDDRPFAFAALVLFDAVGSFVSAARSNISGFANFIASASRDYAAIKREGRYEVEVMVPPGWRVTTDNQVQEFTVKYLAGAPADLVNVTSLTPVGLSPMLEICGRTRINDENQSVTAIKGDTTITSPIGNSGNYSLPVSPGDWIIKFDAGVERLSRYVHVENNPIVLSSIHAGNQPDSRCDVQKISFDDLTTSDALIEVPNGYFGLCWSNVVATHRRLYGGEGYINGATSGEYIAYNGSGHPMSIFREEPFDFLGGDFSAAWFHTEGETLNVRAWHGSELVHQDHVTLSALSPKYFDADYRNITRIEFFTTHHWQMVVGSLEFIFQ